MLSRHVLVLAALCAAQPVLAQDDPRLADAREAYDRGHYAQAFERYAQLADEGHCEAARVARQMMRYGRALYAADFAAPAQRSERWPAGCTLAARR